MSVYICLRVHNIHIFKMARRQQKRTNKKSTKRKELRTLRRHLYAANDLTHHRKNFQSPIMTREEVNNALGNRRPFLSGVLYAGYVFIFIILTIFPITIVCYFGSDHILREKRVQIIFMTMGSGLSSGLLFLIKCRNFMNNRIRYHQALLR